MSKLLKIIKKKEGFLFGITLIALLFILDIWTKRLAFDSVDNIYIKTAGIHTHIKVTNYFNIVQVVNYGVSFGMFNGLQYGQIILSIITLAIVLFVGYLLWKTDKNINVISYSFIIAGGIGNLYDRITFGGVYDFLDFHINGYHWPAFNLADSLICIGVAIILFEDIYSFVKKKKFFSQVE